MHARTWLRCVAVWVAMAGTVGSVFGANATTNTTVKYPTKVNLVFNRSSVVDWANTKNFGAVSNIVFGHGSYDAASVQSPSAKTGTYAIAFGRAYDVGAVEFIWGRRSSGDYIPTNFGLYAASTDVADLYQPAYKIADQTAAFITNWGSGYAYDGVFWPYQVRYDLPSPKAVYKFGMKIDGWLAVEGGGFDFGYLLAASAYPKNAPLAFDGEIGVFNETWTPGGSITASRTTSGTIATTPVYDTNDWCDPFWWLSPVSPGVDITIHLSDYYRLTGVRWAAGQTYLPKNYQVFAADKATTPSAGDWVAVTPATIFTGGNRNTVVDFTAPFDGNWIKINVTAMNGADGWQNSKWQVYGSPIVHTPSGTLILLR